MLGLWEDQGKSFTQQALLLNAITRDIADSMDLASPEAERFGIKIESAAADLAAAQNPMAGGIEIIDLLGEAFEGAGEKAETMRVKFETMMEEVIGESQAINNAKLAAEDLGKDLEDMVTQSATEKLETYFGGVDEATEALIEMREQGVDLGGLEMMGAVDILVLALGEVAVAAEAPLGQFFLMLDTLLQIAGISIPAVMRGPSPSGRPVTFDSRPEALLPAGASGAIVSRPTAALIGEAGPEAVVPLSSAPGASALSGGMGVTNITINMPVGSSGDDIIRSLRNNERLNGSIPITPMAGLG
jgi:hypothetical protein